MKTIFTMMLMWCAMGFTSVIVASDLSAEDAGILKKEGIPVHPDLNYVNGTLGGMAGARFASAKNVNIVRDWYRKEFPKWALNDQYGAWILYDGKAGGGPAAYMTKKQISVVENKNLQSWFGLPASMTTEVIIVIPNAK